MNSDEDLFKIILNLLFFAAIAKCLVHREYVYGVAVYQKISNEVERIDNLRAFARKLSFIPTELDIFEYDNTMYVF